MSDAGQLRRQRHAVKCDLHQTRNATKPSTDYAELILCNLRMALWLLWLSLRAESLAIFRREQEAKDHVPEVARIRFQRIKPVLESGRIRVAPQVPKVLHRYERRVKEVIRHDLTLD